jgi:rhodanese-related sulfurtransferase
MSGVHRTLAIAAASLGGAAAITQMRPAADVAKLAAEIDAERDHISAPDLAGRIVRGDRALRIFDLRSNAEFEQFHIPSARLASLGELARDTFPPEATIVLYSGGGAHAAQAWMLLRMRGYRNVFFLREGVFEWISRVIEPRLAEDGTAAERAEFERAAALSRFFGGMPRSGVPRTEVPTGYWTGTRQDGDRPAGVAPAIERIRRRGC